MWVYLRWRYLPRFLKEWKTALVAKLVTSLSLAALTFLAQYHYRLITASRVRVLAIILPYVLIALAFAVYHGVHTFILIYRDDQRQLSDLRCKVREAISSSTQLADDDPRILISVLDEVRLDSRPSKICLTNAPQYPVRTSYLKLTNRGRTDAYNVEVRSICTGFHTIEFDSAAVIQSGSTENVIVKVSTSEGSQHNDIVRALGVDARIRSLIEQADERGSAEWYAEVTLTATYEDLAKQKYQTHCQLCIRPTYGSATSGRRYTGDVVEVRRVEFCKLTDSLVVMTPEPPQSPACTKVSD